MQSLKFAKSIYRTVVPKSVRHSGVVSCVKQRTLPRNWVYDEDYFLRDVDAAAEASAGVIADSLIREFAPARVLDVGCGTGAMLCALKERGCTAKGFEYADPAIRICRAKGLDITKFDIENDRPDPEARFDLVLSMEVAEHLPEPIADPYVDLLTAQAPRVVITAAPPGQGGTDHVNEQPPEYWIGKFAQRGFDLDAARTEALRTEWEKAGIAGWYHQNLLIFQERGQG